METKETKKNEFKASRERASLSRTEAAKRACISESTLDRLEADETDVSRDTVSRLIDTYNDPFLRNFYCSSVCPLGKGSVEKLDSDSVSLTNSVMTMLSALNAFTKCKDALIAVAADGKISEEESEVFYKIKKYLDRIDVAMRKLNLITKQKEMQGEIGSGEEQSQKGEKRPRR